MVKAKNESILVQRREKLISELQKHKVRVDEFNEFGEMDPEMMKQYVQDVRTLQSKLKEAAIEMAWINNEEELFKMPKSLFPEIDEIQVQSDPFMLLFKTVMKYQKAEKM